MPKNPNASSENAIFGAISDHPNFPKSPKTREINPPRPLDTRRVGRAKGPTTQREPWASALTGKNEEQEKEIGTYASLHVTRFPFLLGQVYNF